MYPPYVHFMLAVAVPMPVTLADFAGPGFPAPIGISSGDSMVAAAWNDVISTLHGITSHESSNVSLPGNITPGHVQNVTFSLGMFSLHDHAAATAMQFHYTSPETAAAPYGTHKVDGNSIYRIASVTKMVTVLTGLLSLKPTDWERSLGDIFGILGDYVHRQSSTIQGVESTPWDKITLTSLAAQIGGVPRDGFPNPGEILIQAVTANISEATIMAASGLPPYNESDPLANPPCLSYGVKPCPPDAYIEGVANRAPAFEPWTTPAYSNNGFTLLGLAIANLTGRSLGELYRGYIFEPLGMKSSSSSAPPPALWPDSAVVVGEPAAGFAFDNGVFVGSGGLFSTTEDLARLGVGILNSTLLPPERTRRWLKPVSHTARLQYAVGAPWEIARYTLASGRVVDLYTKLGDSGSYSALFALLPDYDAGFTILTAGTELRRGDVMSAIADILVDKVVPALEAQAAAETMHNYAGVYTAPADTGLNSTLTISVDRSATAPPGFVLSSFISNGTDVLPWLSGLIGKGPLRLLPSIAGSAEGTKGRQVAFRMVTALDAPSPEGPPSLFSPPGSMSGDWFSIDVSTYYGIGTSLFIIDIGDDGRAESVRPAAWRVKLVRQR